MADLQSLLGDSYRENMTVEEINAALTDKTFVDPSTLPRSVEKSMFDKTTSELGAVKKELAALKNSSLTADEQLQAKLKEVEQTKSDLAKERSKLHATSIFTVAGLQEADYSSILDSVISEDEETTKAKATSVVNLINSQKAAAEKSLREELLKSTPTPPGGQGSSSVDWDKKIEEAKGSGDMALAISLTRQKYEAQKK